MRMIATKQAEKIQILVFGNKMKKVIGINYKGVDKLGWLNGRVVGFESRSRSNLGCSCYKTSVFKRLPY